MGNSNPKSYNNPAAWDEIESKDQKTRILKIEENLYAEDEETLEISESEEIFKENNSEDFSEVLQLTAYNDGALANERNSDFVIAEYTEINTVELEKRHQLEAQKFVSKITKFVLEFNDIVLNEEHKNYIKQIGKFQLQHLSDLLYMVSVNKLMLNNIIARVNATQAEDYAIINSYNNLANQHLKLIKELTNTYKSIPQVMKKMRADIICNQELEENTADEELITSEYGDSQFNNGKQLLKNILEKKNKKIEQNNQQ